eukprot:TRINITY_DN14771_c0_g1_i2.p1 TRINITY_DN14771_c0_g1~~TRINITY_DN14771_c0_g1_i2.p1  ORF type:complete len:565 (+),score=100.87 TRINITY_DN14771_c0_g1_i2:116-1810(+)
MRWKAAFLFLTATCFLYYLTSIDSSEKTDPGTTTTATKSAATSQKDKPNIILILADDLGWNDVGWNQNKKTTANPEGTKTTNVEVKTPSLDKLKAEGIELGRFYAQALCSPTRSALMTGRYQFHTGLGPEYIRDHKPYGVPVDEVFISQLLKRSSYETHIVGKWHLGLCNEAYTPIKRGFDSFLGLLTGSTDHYTHSTIWRDKWSGPYYLDLHNNTKDCTSENSTYSMELFTREAIRIINNHHNNVPWLPLFLFFSLQAVHRPLQVPSRYLTQYQQLLPSGSPDVDKRIKMAAMITNMDEGIGKVMNALRDNDMFDNSVIIFMSDNGGEIPESSNYPLRGRKRTNWEGGIRVPAFIKGTSSGIGSLPKGTKFNELMHVTDWLPTLIKGMLGAETEGCKQLDGVDQWNALKGLSQPPRESLAVTIPPDGFEAITVFVGRYKLLTSGQNCDKDTPQFIHPGFDVDAVPPPEPVIKDGIGYWVFDIISDPTESTNLASNSSLVDTLRDFAVSQQTFAVPDIHTQVPNFDPTGNPKLNGGTWGPFQKSTICPSVMNRRFSKSVLSEPH